tara:strand:+ start:4306 stop:5301 length:996 start_codon:yes stop_codon:yes gene_type:complete
MSSKVKIIAEAGVNHNGNLKLAYRLIDAAKFAGADYVKFQTGIPELSISKYAKKAKYQIKNTKKKESQLQMVKRITLPLSCFYKLKKYSKKKKINFLSSPFDEISLKYLKKLNMEYIKVASGEIINYPLIKKIAKSKKKIILSTGMSTMKEIGNTLKILKKNGARAITLLQCNTEYPTPYEHVNLKAMLTMKNNFKTDVGLSDHSLGIEAPVAAVALGAKIIEKHLTLNKKMKGPDHLSSLEPKEFKLMVRSIRNVEKCLGNGKKIPSLSEKPNIKAARKSIVASRNIYKGELFTSNNLTTKRPGDGLSPMLWNKVLGKKAKKNYLKDQKI